MGVWVGADGTSSTDGGVGAGVIGAGPSDAAGCVGRMGVWTALAVASAIALWNSVSCCCGVAGDALPLLGTLGADVEDVNGVDSGLDGMPTLGADGPLGVPGALGIPGTRGAPGTAGPGTEGGALSGGAVAGGGENGASTRPRLSADFDTSTGGGPVADGGAAVAGLAKPGASAAFGGDTTLELPVGEGVRAGLIGGSPPLPAPSSSGLGGSGASLEPLLVNMLAPSSEGESSGPGKGTPETAAPAVTTSSTFSRRTISTTFCTADALLSSSTSSLSEML